MDYYLLDEVKDVLWRYKALARPVNPLEGRIWLESGRFAEVLAREFDLDLSFSGVDEQLRQLLLRHHRYFLRARQHFIYFKIYIIYSEQ